LNHGNVQTKYDYDVEDNGLFRLYPTGANRYARGDEVLNSYGRRPNSTLLLDYGFAMLDNEWEAVDVPLHPTWHAAPSALRVRALLIRSGLCRGESLPVTAQGFPWDLLAYFRVVGWPAGLVERALRGEVDVDRPTGLRGEAAALQHALQALEDAMDRFATSLESDEAALDGEGVDVYVRMAEADGEGDVRGDRLAVALTHRVTRKRLLRRQADLSRLLVERAQALLAQGGYAGSAPCVGPGTSLPRHLMVGFSPEERSRIDQYLEELSGVGMEANGDGWAKPPPLDVGSVPGPQLDCVVGGSRE
jgi:hypothetical protein